jgi:hypothetical protein
MRDRSGSPAQARAQDARRAGSCPVLDAPAGHVAAGEPVGGWATYDPSGAPYEVTDRGSAARSSPAISSAQASVTTPSPSSP